MVKCKVLECEEVILENGSRLYKNLVTLNVDDNSLLQQKYTQEKLEVGQQYDVKFYRTDDLKYINLRIIVPKKEVVEDTKKGIFNK